MTKASDTATGADTMPSSITELKPLVSEFIEKYKALKNEQEELKEREKDLFEEYEDKIDMKEMRAALRVNNILKKVAHKDAFDNILECLERSAE